VGLSTRSPTLEGVNFQVSQKPSAIKGFGSSSLRDSSRNGQGIKTLPVKLKKLRAFLCEEKRRLEEAGSSAPQLKTCNIHPNPARFLKQLPSYNWVTLKAKAIPHLWVCQKLLPRLWGSFSGFT
jgi:hypothetical protein